MCRARKHPSRMPAALHKTRSSSNESHQHSASVGRAGVSVRSAASKRRDVAKRRGLSGRSRDFMVQPSRWAVK